MFQRKILKAIERQIASREIIVLTGMRRVGKTTLLKMLYDMIKSENKVFLDLENLINRKIFDEVDFNNIWNNLSSLGISKNEKAYVFLDEIQTFPQIVSIVKYLYDHYDVKFFLTGSSSYYLKNLFPESLAGRKILFELYPLDFEEFLIFKEVPVKFHNFFNEKEQGRNYIAYEKRKKYYDEFLVYGGFPQVVLAENEEKKKIYLNDIFTSYFEKDVKILADFKQINAFHDLILLLFQRVGSKLDISKLASALNLSRHTVYSYLSFLEQTYFISLITPYSKSVDREISGTRKVYACDTGFVNLFAKVDEGNLLENAAYNCLRHFGKINYYQKRTGAEIDFILPELNTAIEVKTKADQRDINKLKTLTERLGYEESYVVSKEFVDLQKIISVIDL
ncbi:MAG: ATP-binding protein [Bacteroidales bacterium]|nr:ATP-binding protein [Bacteroidales bacterium]